MSDVSREALERLRLLQENLSIHESVKADLALLLALVEQQEKALREAQAEVERLTEARDSNAAAYEAMVWQRDRATKELRYTHDRGDHLVYENEWQEFDRWQRWRDDEIASQAKYQPTAQEFNDAMEGT